MFESIAVIAYYRHFDHSFSLASCFAGCGLYVGQSSMPILVQVDHFYMQFNIPPIIDATPDFPVPTHAVFDNTNAMYKTQFLITRPSGQSTRSREIFNIINNADDFLEGTGKKLRIFFLSLNLIIILRQTDPLPKYVPPAG